MLEELIKKEVKDLVRDPRIWIPFIISALILPLMGLVISSGVKESVSDITSPINILVSDLDRTELTAHLINDLKTKAIASRVEVASTSDVEELTALASNLNCDVVILIDEGFTESINRNMRPNITAIDIVKSAAFIPSLKSSIVASAINDLLGKYILENYGVNVSLQLIKSPTNIVTLTYIVTRNQTLPSSPAVLTQLSITSFTLPLAFMVITIGVLQMASTSTAIENEEKTLEVLLTLPISRFKILLGKLLGSFTVALVGSTLNIVGFILYFYIFAVGMSSAIGSVEGFTPSLHYIQPESMAYLAISLMLASFAMATLGVTIGVLSSDVRIATTLSGSLSMFVIIPSYYVMFTDISKLNPTIKLMLYTIPFTQPMAMSKELMLSKPDPLVPLWLLASLTFSVVLVLLTSRILVFEKMIRIQKTVSRFRRSK